jgi:hypothetical protein
VAVAAGLALLALAAAPLRAETRFGYIDSAHIFIGGSYASPITFSSPMTIRSYLGAATIGH